LGSTVNVLLVALDVPHSLLTDNEIEYVPGVAYVSPEGVALLEDDGDAPVNVQAYVSVLVLGAQLATVADGVKLLLLQKLSIVASETVGGCFTFTVLVILALPHELVTVNLIV
jgi:hypothetical protein